MITNENLITISSDYSDKINIQPRDARPDTEEVEKNLVGRYLVATNSSYIGLQGESKKINIQGFNFFVLEYDGKVFIEKGASFEVLFLGNYEKFQLENLSAGLSGSTDYTTILNEISGKIVDRNYEEILTNLSIKLGNIIAINSGIYDNTIPDQVVNEEITIPVADPIKTVKQFDRNYLNFGTSQIFVTNNLCYVERVVNNERRWQLSEINDIGNYLKNDGGYGESLTRSRTLFMPKNISTANLQIFDYSDRDESQNSFGYSQATYNVSTGAYTSGGASNGSAKPKFYFRNYLPGGNAKVSIADTGFVFGSDSLNPINDWNEQLTGITSIVNTSEGHFVFTDFNEKLYYAKVKSDGSGSTEVYNLSGNLATSKNDLEVKSGYGNLLNAFFTNSGVFCVLSQGIIKLCADGAIVVKDYSGKPDGVNFEITLKSSFIENDLIRVVYQDNAFLTSAGFGLENESEGCISVYTLGLNGSLQFEKFLEISGDEIDNNKVCFDIQSKYYTQYNTVDERDDIKTVL